jgi:gluconolactonase
MREVMRARCRFANMTAALLVSCMGCTAAGDGGGGSGGTNGGNTYPAPVGGSGGTPAAGSGGQAVLPGGSGGMGSMLTGGSGGSGHAGVGVPPGTGGAGDGGSTAIPDGDAGTPSGDSGMMVAPVVYPAIEASQFGTPVMIADTFSLAEGPVWDHCDGVLLFTDVDAAVIHKLTPPSTVEVFRMNSNYANGLAYDPQGQLVMAQMGPDTASGKIARINTAGMEEVIVDKGPMGVATHAIDDLTILSDGTIYFTDPEFAHGPCSSTLTCNDLLGQLPIYRATPDGMVTLEGMTTGPNGIDPSPDEKTLYVNSYFGGRTMRFTIGADRSLTAATALASGLNYPDSMCIDDAGNVYVGVRTGVDVLQPDGTLVTNIPVPYDPTIGASRTGVTNCGFGGNDGKTLYITAWTTLYRVENVPIPGHEWVVNQKKPCN